MIDFIVLIIATEALTKLMRDASIFDTPRNWLIGKGTFLADLLPCGYCLSVWAAAIIFSLYYLGLTIFIALLALHRGANLFHDLISTLIALKIKLRMHRD